MERKESREVGRWEDAKSGASLFLDGGLLIYGKVPWVAKYTIGFVPNEQGNEASTIGAAGMTAGKESVVNKGAIRVMTPKSMNKGQINGRRTSDRSR